MPLSERTSIDKTPASEPPQARRPSMKSVTYAAAVLAFAVCGASAAAPYATIEEAAVVTDDNVTRFESDSIMVQGETRRFDVTVAWRDGVVRPDGAPPRKIVRYLVKCDQ